MAVNKDLKILFLCKKFPFPLRDGESIAIHNLTKALAKQGCQISLLCLNTSKHKFDLASLPQHVDQYAAIHAIDVDTEVNAKGAFKNLFSKDSYHISRFDSQKFRTQLIRLLDKEDYDIVQLETLTMAIYLPELKQYSNAAIVMRSHNVEHQIWDRLSKNVKSPLRKMYIKYLTKKLKKFELAKLSDYDLLLTVSQNDLDYFKGLGYKGASQVVPIGIDLSKYALKESKSKDVFFIGSMDWMPNSFGLKWFMDEVWPEVLQNFPELRLHIAGRNAQSLPALEQLVNHGEVDSALDFMNAHGIMIVPLFSGSGTRVKIIEGLALGKVIISTSIGAEGIDLIHGKQILFANTKEEFLDAIQRCLNNPGELVRMSQEARKFIEENYDGDIIAKHLIPSYMQLLSSKKKNA